VPTLESLHSRLIAGFESLIWNRLEKMGGTRFRADRHSRFWWVIALPNCLYRAVGEVALRVVFRSLWALPRLAVRCYRTSVRNVF